MSCDLDVNLRNELSMDDRFNYLLPNSNKVRHTAKKLSHDAPENAA